MSDFNKKILVSVIKKLAQVPSNQGGGDDGGLGDVWTAPTPKATPGAGGRGGGNPAIKAMQEKMIALSAKVRAQLNIDKVDPKDQRASGEAEGRASFSNFVARMLRGQGGYEYTPDKSAVKQEQKGPMAQTRMHEVMDTVNRIGGPAAEITPDGVWGFRTNNALLNIRSFAESMLTMAAAFGLPIKSYSQANVNEFILPKKDTDISLQDKIKSAPIIGEHIDAISDMFDEIKGGILENPQYETYIEDDTPYATFAPPKPQPGQPGAGQQSALVGPEEAQEIAKVFPQFTVGFTGPDGQAQSKAIGISNLVTLQALQAWMKQNNVNIPVADIAKQIRTQVSLPPRRYTPQQDQAFYDKQWKQEQEAAKNMRQQRPGTPGVSGQVGVRTSSKR